MTSNYLQTKVGTLPLAAQIEVLLRSRGIMSAAEIIAATGKSQQLVSLALRSLGTHVCKLGAARATRYALKRSFFGHVGVQPVKFTDASGVTALFGTLTHLTDGRTFVRTEGGEQWLTEPDAFPWFLATLRPQGFLGREYAQLRPDFPPNPDEWTIEQALYVATIHATDPPGAFSLGAIGGRLMAEAPQNAAERAQHYDQVAASVGARLPAHSSAGGEQPKFVAGIGDSPLRSRPVIVKFSPPRDTPFGERWHALLHLEHLANQVLSERGVAVAKTNTVESATRTYLESERFDRVGRNGKHHVVAIDAIDGHFNTAPRINWLKSSEALHAKKLITRDELETVARLFAFGQFIGNTDMHFGNLSFYVDDVVRPRIRLAPVYDMLPMMWRPGIHTGELDVTPVREGSAVPGHASAYADARQWAINYWERAASHPQLVPALQRACEESAARVRALS